MRRDGGDSYPGAGGGELESVAFRASLNKPDRVHRAAADQRRWPMPMPIVLAFCRTAPSVRFIVFAIFETGVLALSEP
jgi:hypothetical protein